MQPGLIEIPSPDIPGQKLRKFDVAAIAKMIDEAVATIPEGKHASAIAYVDVIDKQVKLAAMARIGSQWSVMVYTGYDWKDKKPMAGAAVQWAF